MTPPSIITIDLLANHLHLVPTIGEIRRQFAQDIPLWSEYIRQEAERFSLHYVDMIGDFHSRLSEADAILTAGVITEGSDSEE
jgi:hypothetical protein